MSIATIKEDSWDFCCVLGDSNDVSVSSAGAAALQRALFIYNADGAVEISKRSSQPRRRTRRRHRTTRKEEREWVEEVNVASCLGINWVEGNDSADLASDGGLMHRFKS
jgi:hypothetical protein